MTAFAVGQEVSWNGVEAIVVAVGGDGWGALIAEPLDEEDVSRETAAAPTGRVAIGLRIRDQDPPRDGYLDEETEEIVKHADVGDWLPLWVNASALRSKKARSHAA